jgi:hypothetical protein
MSTVASTARKHLLPSAIDEQAVSRPNDVCFAVPKDDNDLSLGFEDISCGNFANAINHAATWLHEHVDGRGSVPFDVIAYQGPNDLRYPILAVAAGKVGVQVR